MMMLDGLVSGEVGDFFNHVEQVASLVGRAIPSDACDIESIFAMQAT
jgi:hypothetical protein